MRKRDWALIWLLWGVVFGFIFSGEAEASEVVPPPYTDMSGRKLSTLECLAVNAYHEARGESDIANLMIMAVVEQRVRDTRHRATTICEAVFHPKAFSWVSDGRSDRIRDKGQYLRLYKLSEKFLINKEFFINVAEGADHYHVVGHKTGWNYRVLTYIGQVDRHVFYRWNR